MTNPEGEVPDYSKVVAEGEIGYIPDHAPIPFVMTYRALRGLLGWLAKHATSSEEDKLVVQFGYELDKLYTSINEAAKESDINDTMKGF